MDCTTTFINFSTLTEMRSPQNRSHTICILSVPATMTCHDLMTFTAACHQDIQYFRIIRDGNPNQYMTLMTFRSSVNIFH
jgi:BRCA1-associated protein